MSPKGSVAEAALAEYVTGCQKAGMPIQALDVDSSTPPPVGGSFTVTASTTYGGKFSARLSRTPINCASQLHPLQLHTLRQLAKIVLVVLQAYATMVSVLRPCLLFLCSWSINYERTLMYTNLLISCATLVSYKPRILVHLDFLDASSFQYFIYFPVCSLFCRLVTGLVLHE